MFIEDLNKKDYIVTNNKGAINTGKIVDVNTFLEEANSDEGLDINGDLYCHIPDFDPEVYSIISQAVEGTIWFVFNKGEIPDWFKADEAVVLELKEVKHEAPKPIPNSQNNMTQVTNSKTKTKPSPSSGYNRENINNIVDPTNRGDVDIDNNDLAVQNTLNNYQEESSESGNKEAKIYVFGSSKGGTGKTFTCLISAYRYGKTHPSEKIAVADFDIIDGQVGISIFKVQPTMMSYWKNYISGDRSFRTMKEFSTKADHFPSNIDFFLAPKDYYINDKRFWISILDNLIKNYDTVFFDTGIDYINYPPISFVYKIADRIVLTTTTSIKSVSSVLKQISKLKGISSSANANGEEVFSKEDEIGPKLRLAITGYNRNDTTNQTIIDTFAKNIKINAIFGQYYTEISRAEYYGEWDLFDDNKKFNQALDKLLDLKQ